MISVYYGTLEFADTISNNVEKALFDLDYLLSVAPHL